MPTMDKNQLTHAGVKGMRWGIRRWQNKDGSLTTAGKKRYGDSDSNTNPGESKKTSAKLSGKKKVSEVANSTSTAKGKKAIKTAIGILAGTTIVGLAGFAICKKGADALSDLGGIVVKGGQDIANSMRLLTF